MDPTLKEIYSLVLPGAKFVIAAYGILWATLVVYIAMVFRRLSRLERELKIVADAVERRSAKA